MFNQDEIQNYQASPLPPNRIESCLARLQQENRKALIPFLVAGDPDLATTRELALTVLNNGADILELGVPFSDPSAEGPVIMAADARALAGGTRLADVFELVDDLRRDTQAPILLLLYFNSIYKHGISRFFARCQAVGIDGVIVPDLPLEEQDTVAPAAQAANVILTRLVTPLSGARLPRLVEQARGFLYCVAALGVTGERSNFQTDLKAYSRQLASLTGMPRALGFGISTPEQVRELAVDWDALIVGSAIVRRVAEGVAAGLDRTELCRQLAIYCQSLRQAMDEAVATTNQNGKQSGQKAGKPVARQAAKSVICTPAIDDFCRLAGQYRLIPVSRRLTADMVTPISLFRRFDDQKSAYLLESVISGERWARYSIMGRRPLFRLVSRGPELKLIPGEEPLSAQHSDTVKPIDVIRKLLKDYALPPELSGQGFRCGLVGYFAYDFIRYLECLPDQNPDELNLPDCDLMAPAEVVLYDHLKSELTLINNVLVGDDPAASYAQAVAALDKMAADLFSSETAPIEDPERPTRLNLDFQSNISRDDYIAQVVQAKQYIRQGDIFQVVLSQRFSADYAADPFAVYRALRHVNPSPYLFYLRCPNAVLVGASPEMMVRLDGRTITTCPIAGTRRRGATPELDDALAADLLADAKERAEHAMLVDLARNDVGRISQFGSVQVKDFCHVERFSHVMHLVTLVEGQLREDRSAIDVLAAILPAGTLSGAPKVRAMAIIDELEKIRRGPYGGAVGYLGFDGQLDTCITIRTAILKDNRIHIQAGAGIVADSVPESEYDETVNKAMALFMAINKAGDFL